jgi:SAM-dependent methyltransferase
MKNQNDPTAKFYDIVSKAMKPQEITDQEVTLVETVLGHDTSKTILDVGCGTGRHSIPLLSLGYSVHGVEESEEMLKQLKEKASDIPVYNESHFGNESIYEYKDDTKFDLIILFWNTFNESALTDEKALELIRKLDSLLSANGKILINSDDPSVWKIENYTYGYSTEVYGIPAEYNWSLFEYDKVSGVSKSRETVILKPEGKAEEVHETEIHQRWYTFEKYEELFKTLGFKLEKQNIPGNKEMYVVASRIS